MNMSAKGKSSDQFGAAVHTRQGARSGVRSRNIWGFEARGPLLVSDPQKFRDLCVPSKDIILPDGKMWVKGWNRLRNRLQEISRPLLKELESLIDGGGDILWVDGFTNLTVNVGLQEIADKAWKGSAYTAAHYVGLTDGAPVTVAAGDTMASHAGWVEVTAYSETVRQTLTLGTFTAADPSTANNTGNEAQYSINGTTTVGGGFVTTSNAKSGTTGILMCAGAFTGGDKGLGSGDTLSVTVTLTVGDDGV